MQGSNIMVPTLPRSNRLSQRLTTSAPPQKPTSAAVVPPSWASVRSPAIQCNNDFSGGASRWVRSVPQKTAVDFTEFSTRLTHTDAGATPDTGATAGQADTPVCDPTPAFLAIVERERADRDFALQCLEQRVMAEVKSVAFDRSSSQYLLSSSVPESVAALPQALDLSHLPLLQEAVAEIGCDLQDLRDKFAEASARITEVSSDFQDLRVKLMAESALRVVADRTTVGELSSLRLNLDDLLTSIIGDQAAEERASSSEYLDLHAKLLASQNSASPEALANSDRNSFQATSLGAALKDFDGKLADRIARQCKRELEAHSEKTDAEVGKRITEQCGREFAASFKELKEFNASMSERLAGVCKDFDAKMSSGVSLESHVAEIGQALAEHLSMHRQQELVANKAAQELVEQDLWVRETEQFSQCARLDLSAVVSTGSPIALGNGASPGAVHTGNGLMAPFEKRVSEELLRHQRDQVARMAGGGIDADRFLGDYLKQVPDSARSSRSSFAMTVYSPSFCDGASCTSAIELQSVEVECNMPMPLDAEEADQAAKDVELMRAIVAQHQKVLQRGHMSHS